AGQSQGPVERPPGGEGGRRGPAEAQGEPAVPRRGREAAQAERAVPRREPAAAVESERGTSRAVGDGAASAAPAVRAEPRAVTASRARRDPSANATRPAPATGPRWRVTAWSRRRAVLCWRRPSAAATA